jgi:hypothetical protein
MVANTLGYLLFRSSSSVDLVSHAVFWLYSNMKLHIAHRIRAPAAILVTVLVPSLQSQAPTCSALWFVSPVATGVAGAPIPALPLPPGFYLQLPVGPEASAFFRSTYHMLCTWSSCVCTPPFPHRWFMGPSLLWPSTCDSECCGLGAVVATLGGALLQAPRRGLGARAARASPHPPPAF